MTRVVQNPGFTGLVTFVCLIWLHKNAGLVEIVAGYAWVITIAVFEMREIARQNRKLEMLIKLAEQNASEREPKEISLGPDA